MRCVSPAWLAGAALLFATALVLLPTVQWTTQDVAADWGRRLGIYSLPNKTHQESEQPAKLLPGERPIPARTNRLATNPWWKSVQVWRKSSREGKRQKMIVIGGLPRSGTTLLEMFIAAHGDEVSMLKFAKGDHIKESTKLLGSKFSKFQDYGGSIQAYSKMCKVDDDGDVTRPLLHLTKGSPEFQLKAFRKATAERWSSWDFTKPALLSKDPANLFRMRFMEVAFGDTHDVFPIFTIMHPLELRSTIYPCDAFSKPRMDILKNWLHCHAAWLEDLAQLDTYLIVPFEAWFIQSEETARMIEVYLKLREHVSLDRQSSPSGGGRRLIFEGKKLVLREKYFAKCNPQVQEAAARHDWPLREHAAELAKYGYNLSNTKQFWKPTLFPLCKVKGKLCSEL